MTNLAIDYRDTTRMNETNSEFNYHLLKHALNRFEKNVQQLDARERDQTEALAMKSFELESRVLGSPLSRQIVISAEQVQKSIDEIRLRYADHEEYVADLSLNGLDESSLSQAIYRELMFDAVMQRVTSEAEQTSELDARVFYEMHPQRFTINEKRVARHILITINDDYLENTRDQAWQRINKVKQELKGRGNRFSKFAQRYSECPTAMDGGKLGEVEQGHLYPEVDAVLFAMDEETVSEIVESEMGFHLLYCEKVKQMKKVPFTRVRLKIMELLNQRQRHTLQQAWLKSLKDDNTGDQE